MCSARVNVPPRVSLARLRPLCRIRRRDEAHGGRARGAKVLLGRRRLGRREQVRFPERRRIVERSRQGVYGGRAGATRRGGDVQSASRTPARSAASSRSVVGRRSDRPPRHLRVSARDDPSAAGTILRPRAGHPHQSGHSVDADPLGADGRDGIRRAALYPGEVVPQDRSARRAGRGAGDARHRDVLHCGTGGSSTCAGRRFTPSARGRSPAVGGVGSICPVTTGSGSYAHTTARSSPPTETGTSAAFALEDGAGPERETVQGSSRRVPARRRSAGESPGAMSGKAAGRSRHGCRRPR